MKSAEQIIAEVDGAIAVNKEKGLHIYYSYDQLLTDEAVIALRNHYQAPEYFYVSVYNCGCGASKYEILIQWI